MAFRIFQFSIVFTIVFIIYIVKVSPTVVDGAGVTLGELSESSLGISNPQDVTLSKGSRNQFLRCRTRYTEAGGLPIISWLGPIANNTPHIEMRDDLLIFNKPLKPSYAGEYRCLVENKDGKLLSSSAKVQLAALSKTFTEEPQDTTVELGQPVHLKCQIQSTPHAKITWEKDRKPLVLNSRFIILSSGDLFISVVKSSDEGSYRCLAENKLIKNKNVRISSEASLTVIPIQKIERAPTFLPIFKNQTNFTAKLGENFQLICAVQGWPIPTIKWTRKGENVSLGNSSVLLLRNLNLKNNDTYLCTTSNSQGRTTQVFNIEVVQAPYFTKVPTSYWFWSARTVRLECVAQGIPIPEITWFKDGEPLVLDGRVKKTVNGLVLSHTFTTDSGFYQCIAKNKIGEIWTASQLIARTSNQPKAPSNLSCRPFNNRSVCLQWDPPLNDTVKAYSIYAYGGKSQEYVTNDTYKLADNLDSNTNYSFYVRAYTGVASDKSENIVCQTVVLNERKMSFKAISSTILLIEWNTLSNDVPCGGTVEYKLQWRRAGHPSNNAEIVKTNSFIIRGLIPSNSYEMRVQTLNSEENTKWENFTMPETDDDTINSIQGAVNDSELKQILPNRTISIPNPLEASPLSSKSIVLSWKVPDENINNFYKICYYETKSQQNCENGAHFLESSTTKKEIKGLKPHTKYSFRVRSENLDGTQGPYSQVVECKTPEDVPSPVTDLKWKKENSTAVCLKWRKPNHFNGELKHYLISYTSNQTLELDNWPTLILPAQKANLPGCWGYGYDTISTFLGPLIKGHKYFVVIRAATNAGLSKPTETVQIYTFLKNIPVETQNTENSENYSGLQDDQKLGIIIGTVISLFCVIGCISCMIFRRKCVKSRGLDRVRVANPQTTNGQTVHQIPAQPVSTVPTLPVAQIRQCNDAEVHELQCLVSRDTVMSHIPPLVHSNLDSKGGTLYPNGQINGLKYFPLSNGNIPNGNVHITENPQYEPYECNGHFNSTSESRQLLSGEAERSGNSDDTLNSTQLTSLDDTLTLSTHRTVSPILGPNG